MVGRRLLCAPKRCYLKRTAEQTAVLPTVRMSKSLCRPIQSGFRKLPPTPGSKLKWALWTWKPAAISPLQSTRVSKRKESEKLSAKTRRPSFFPRFIFLYRYSCASPSAFSSICPLSFALPTFSISFLPLSLSPPPLGGPPPSFSAPPLHRRWVCEHTETRVSAPHRVPLTPSGLRVCCAFDRTFTLGSSSADCPTVLKSARELVSSTRGFVREQ